MSKSNAPWRATKPSMWSKKRIPVVMQAFPRPSRLSFSRMSVSFVFRWIVAMRPILNLFCSGAFSPRRLPFLSDELQQPLHFCGSSDGDADEATLHVFASVAKQNALPFQLAKKRRSRGTKICQKKIPGAWVSLDAQRAQFLRGPCTQTFHISDISPHPCRVACGCFCGGQRGEVYGKRRHRATNKRKRVRTSNHCAKPQRCEASDFGKCSRDEKLWILLNPRKRGEVRKLRISFIHHHHRSRRRLKDALQLFLANKCACWIVRIGNE